MKIVRVDINEELTSASIEKRQNLNVSVINYVFSKSKMKSEQSKMNKTYNFRYLLRVL